MWGAPVASACLLDEWAISWFCTCRVNGINLEECEHADVVEGRGGAWIMKVLCINVARQVPGLASYSSKDTGVVQTLTGMTFGLVDSAEWLAQ